MILGYILATFLDVHSSCLALNRGAHEILLPFKTCKSISISQAVIVSNVIIYNTKYLKYHKRIRKMIYISAIITHTSAAIHNYRRSR